MTAGWVPVFDQSFQRVPINRLHEMWTAGYRVMAGYAGGGSSNKWLTLAEIDEWLSFGLDAGIAALFEIKGTEPIDNPSSGKLHAQQARAAWRALGYPDHAAISPAVDENVTVAEARAQLTTYFHYWANADTTLAIPYVEKDAGAILYNEGWSNGTFTPAAFSWDPSNTLVTPDNAPSHVVWTQEHNGKTMAGGNVDIGHIRKSALIRWGVNEMDEASIAAKVWATAPNIATQVWHTDQFTPVNGVYSESGSARMDRLDKMQAYVMSPKFIADIAAASAGGADATAIATAVVTAIRAVWAA